MYDPRYYNKEFQATANKWWRSLSIKEMRAFEDKYHVLTRPAIPSDVAKIYDGEMLKKES